jgi:hypothetical protein
MASVGGMAISHSSSEQPIKANDNRPLNFLDSTVPSFLGTLGSSPGYPMHLAASTALFFAKMGINDPAIEAPMLVLANNKVNRGAGPFSNGVVNSAGDAFYDYVAFGNGPLILADIFASCPAASPNTPAPKRTTTWHWQNSVTGTDPETDVDWVAIDYWDCIFAANLYNNAAPPPLISPAQHGGTKGIE